MDAEALGALTQKVADLAVAVGRVTDAAVPERACFDRREMRTMQLGDLAGRVAALEALGIPVIAADVAALRAAAERRWPMAATWISVVVAVGSMVVAVVALYR